jgi:hypothetical protein
MRRYITSTNLVSPSPKASATLGVLLFVSASNLALAAKSPVAAQMDFNREIRPILSENCFKCHGPDPGARKAGLRLDIREEAMKATKSGHVPIVPRAPDQSEIIARITAEDADDRMPPAKSRKHLEPEQIALLKRWVATGANYAPHWAYVPPVRPEIPAVKNSRWPANPIDNFILNRLEHERLRPSSRAPREILARRVSLALTGLPPTISALDRFLADKSKDAYNRFVDQLLASPSFGERWAAVWLDLARYADSAGYADDPPRTIWAYRDYVVRAFNQNKHFDRFTLEQIAGDLLPDSDDEDLIATAFHRNTMTNNEGGTQDEEFRNAAVIDRVNTTMAVWMATSMGCAQCHDHKYDPITQKEYFSFFAILNNTADSDKKDESPVLKLPTSAETAEKRRLQSELKAAEAIPATNTNRDDAIAGVKKKLAAIKPNSVPVMRELATDKHRETRVQLRGNYQALADKVSATTPAVFHPVSQSRQLDRLTLAEWLVDRKNPLTARVLVNRLWEQIYGIGLVRTTDDFGSQGDLPTHPELLDWLATELTARDWDIKAVLKLMVTSATYCQTSKPGADTLNRDPENLLLGRGPRFRLPAEAVRDEALAISGLLSDKMYGPPVRPPQPALALTAAFGGSLDWKTSEGPDRYRRALYTEWRRTNPYASMATFDAPNRETCALHRPRSNTPLQALVTLNDPVFIEAAQSLGRRMSSHAGSNQAKLSFGFRLATSRSPHSEELKELARLFQNSLATYEKDLEAAKLMAGETRKMQDTPAATVAESASWSVIGNVLLNLDETLMPL